MKFDLNRTIHKLTLLRQQEFRNLNVEVILDLGVELPETSADGEQVECALLALLTGARDAIVRAKKPSGTISMCTSLKQGKLQFSISNDGPGDGHDTEGAFTAGPEEDRDLAICAQVVQAQAGQMFAWRPRHSSIITIMMDLPV